MSGSTTVIKNPECPGKWMGKSCLTPLAIPRQNDQRYIFISGLWGQLHPYVWASTKVLGTSSHFSSFFWLKCEKLNRVFFLRTTGLDRKQQWPKWSRFKLMLPPDFCGNFGGSEDFRFLLGQLPRHHPIPTDVRNIFSASERGFLQLRGTLTSASLW